MLALAGPSASLAPPGAQTPVISTLEEIKADALSVPCKNSERKAAVIALLEKMGAADSDVAMQKLEHVENLVLSIPGAGSGKIVVGAHYDKVQNGCGAVDNWTGIVAMAHLYRTRKSAAPQKTYIFVAFGREEEGLLGSKAMVRSIGKDQAHEYCAMINIDSLGMGAVQIADNMSNKKLMDRAAEKAQKMKIPFGHAPIFGGDSDSSSFNARGIPAVTIHGLTNDWPKVLHTANDQVSKVHPESVYLAYRLALAMIWDLDAEPCDVSR
jgi:putative aminopeptidase FrvX